MEFVTHSLRRRSGASTEDAYLNFEDFEDLRGFELKFLMFLYL